MLFLNSHVCSKSMKTWTDVVNFSNQFPPLGKVGSSVSGPSYFLREKRFWANLAKRERVLHLGGGCPDGADLFSAICHDEEPPHWNFIWNCIQLAYPGFIVIALAVKRQPWLIFCRILTKFLSSQVYIKAHINAHCLWHPHSAFVFQSTFFFLNLSLIRKHVGNSSWQDLTGVCCIFPFYT